MDDQDHIYDFEDDFVPFLNQGGAPPPPPPPSILQHACLNTHKQPFSSPPLLFFNQGYLPFVL